MTVQRRKLFAKLIACLCFVIYLLFSNSIWSVIGFAVGCVRGYSSMQLEVPDLFLTLITKFTSKLTTMIYGDVVSGKIADVSDIFFFREIQRVLRGVEMDQARKMQLDLSLFQTHRWGNSFFVL